MVNQTVDEIDLIKKKDMPTISGVREVSQEKNIDADLGDPFIDPKIGA